MTCLALRPVAWDSNVAAHLLTAVDVGDKDDPTDLDWFRREYEARRMALVGAFDGGVHVATAGYRLEETAGDLEFVIVVCGAALRGLSVVQHFLPPLENLAHMAGAKVVRFHTTRGGLVKVAGDVGYHVGEYVLRKRVRHDQQE